jgi:hypothetical protein
LQTRRLEAEAGLARGFGGRLHFYNRNDASAAHAGLKRALPPKNCPIELYPAATNVRTRKVKPFATQSRSMAKLVGTVATLAIRRCSR